MLQYRDWNGTQYWSERKGNAIRYIIVHDTEGPRDAAFAWWSSPNNPYQSSAHDLIDSAGVIWRCVPYEKAAHHAGGGHIDGYNEMNTATGQYEPNANLPTIGIELEYPAAPASPPWPQPQVDALVEHVRNLVRTYQIPRANVLRHADIDAVNRSDPRNLGWEDLLNRIFEVKEDDLSQALRHAAWNSGGIAYNVDAAFPRYAREHGLGNPETAEFDFAFGGQQFRGQGFSKVVIFARVGQWDEIKEVAW